VFFCRKPLVGHVLHDVSRNRKTSGFISKNGADVHVWGQVGQAATAPRASRSRTRRVSRTTRYSSSQPAVCRCLLRSNCSHVIGAEPGLEAPAASFQSRTLFGSVYAAEVRHHLGLPAPTSYNPAEYSHVRARWRAGETAKRLLSKYCFVLLARVCMSDVRVGASFCVPFACAGWSQSCPKPYRHLPHWRPQC
jgi:hypothetical protein